MLNWYDQGQINLALSGLSQMEKSVAKQAEGLLGFLMGLMSAARRTVLLQLKLSRRVFLVLLRSVIFTLALLALELDIDAHTFTP